MKKILFLFLLYCIGVFLLILSLCFLVLKALFDASEHMNPLAPFLAVLSAVFLWLSLRVFKKVVLGNIKRLLSSLFERLSRLDERLVKNFILETLDRKSFGVRVATGYQFNRSFPLKRSSLRRAVSVSLPVDGDSPGKIMLTFCCFIFGPIKKVKVDVPFVLNIHCEERHLSFAKEIEEIVARSFADIFEITAADVETTIIFLSPDEILKEQLFV